MRSELEHEARRALERLAREGSRRVIRPDAGIDFASNDYLGLRRDPRVLAAAHAALEEHGLGAGAARLLRGDHAPHRALEGALAKLCGTEDALSFPSGFHANYGVLQALGASGWRIVSDQNNHASLIDGCRAARAECVVVPHNDLDAFERAIESERTLVVCESVYSMSGDRSPVADLGEICARKGATLLVDEAHAIGVVPLEAGAHVRIVPCGKALGGAGAVVCGPRAIVDLLRSSCRTFLFSTALPPAIAAGVLVALDIALNEPERARRALELARRVSMDAQSCIVPVPCRDNAAALRAQALLAEEGLDVRAVRPPTVPQAMLRLSLHADRTDAEVARLLAALQKMREVRPAS